MSIFGWGKRLEALETRNKHLQTQITDQDKTIKALLAKLGYYSIFGKVCPEHYEHPWEEDIQLILDHLNLEYQSTPATTKLVPKKKT